MKDGRPEGCLATRYQVVILGRKNWTTSVAHCQPWHIKSCRRIWYRWMGGGMGFVGGVVVCPRRPRRRRKGRRGEDGGFISPIVTALYKGIPLCPTDPARRKRW